MQNRLKTFLRDQPVIRAGLLRAGATVRSLSRARPGIYTLCYHRIAASSGAGFSAQIEHLKRFGEFIDVDTAAERVASGRAATGISFLLSFDDGYADNVDVALPIIKRHAVPAMLFLVSDWISAPPHSTDSIKHYMNRDDVRTWLDAGLDIGSHSASHCRFSQLDEASAQAELARSHDTLTQLAGKPVRHFACPWGVADADYLSARDPALAQRSGYRTFFTTRRGRALDASDLLSMPRHVVEPEWPIYQLEALLGGPRYAWN